MERRSAAKLYTVWWERSGKGNGTGAKKFNQANGKPSAPVDG
jgi:hypothetical protein